MKRVAVLGSTGSIGTQTLDVIDRHPDELKVVGLAAGRNAELLSQQARERGVTKTALFDAIVPGIKNGIDALCEIASDPEVDLVVVAVAGVIGLLPTLAAIQSGKQVALASKEVLVAAGEIVMPEIRKHKTVLTPIDSEHSAMFQCLQGYRPDQTERLILTASGGPFRGKKRSELERITVEDALNHPTWRMGGKITIDSATLMNKGLETIEARWLFDVPIEKVDVVVHPQSIIHSMVEYKDGSVLGQLGWPDMRLPIAYALLYPERKPSGLRPWQPTLTPSLTFEPVDEETFPSLNLARTASRIGKTLPCVMNAANEEAVGSFLRGEIGFLEITEVVERAMAAHQPSEPTLESLIAADAEGRAFARNHKQLA